MCRRVLGLESGDSISWAWVVFPGWYSDILLHSGGGNSVGYIRGEVAERLKAAVC